jgi:hypothetical protein
VITCQANDPNNAFENIIKSKKIVDISLPGDAKFVEKFEVKAPKNSSGEIY